MPTYEYECRSCHKRFDLLQPMSARPSARCPKCGKASRRLISSGAGLMFKGSGFYATDHRSSSYKSKAKADSCGSKPSSSKESCPKPGCPKGGSSGS